MVTSHAKLDQKIGKPGQDIVVPGYRFAGVSSGIKESKALDLALIVSDRPAQAVATFTTNRVKAAPVLQGQQVLKNGKLQAVVINSGNANAATGQEGLKHSFETADCAAKELGLDSDLVLVSSTGKIGEKLPIAKITRAIPGAVTALSSRNFSLVAQSIVTTDRFVKTCQLQGQMGKKTFHVTGVAKGAGMIEPHMATMLAYIMTDLSLPIGLMRRSFRQIVETSFNSITVDGDTSTNDTALLMANGTSGLYVSSTEDRLYKKFKTMCHQVCKNLAWMMVADGEGATKLVEICVQGAQSHKAAKRVAYSVARSQLVKTSIFGEDPNWGRVLAAIGYSGETFDPSKVDIYYGPICLMRNGSPISLNSKQNILKYMKNLFVKISINLKGGSGESKVWTSDLGYEYVRINAEYHT